jgi:hypothetical protein
MAGKELSAEKKLVWLGLRNPQQSTSEVASEVRRLQEQFNSVAEFQDELNDLTSFDDLRSSLEDADFSGEQAQRFIDKIKQNFDSFDAFKQFADGAGSFQDLKTGFGTGFGFTGENQTEQGGKAAGIEIHDQPATSRNGVELPASTVEVFGRRIEFSETNALQSGAADIVYSELSVSPTTPAIGETVTVSATVSNAGDARGTTFPQLRVDGGVAQSQGPLRLAPGASESVTFETEIDSLVTVDVTIGNLPPETIAVEPSSFGEGI